MSEDYVSEWLRELVKRCIGGDERACEMFCIEGYRKEGVINREEYAYRIGCGCGERLVNYPRDIDININAFKL